MEYKISEIAPDIYRISVYAAEFDLQFNHFLVKDQQPLLFHTGLRQMFPVILEAVKKIIPVEELKWIGFSHFESDECGSLNEWLQVAPNAQTICTQTGALVNLQDFAIRPPHPLEAGEVITTGIYRFRLFPTPHLPHGWDAGLLFEESQRTLFCSDLFHQNGQVMDITDKDILGAHQQALEGMQQSPLMDYSPYTQRVPLVLNQLAELQPNTLATMHGSSFNGNCSQALLDLNEVMKKVLG
jgi:flavorubredoxin